MVNISMMTVGSILANDRGISVGVMYPGEHDPNGIPLIRVADILNGAISKPTYRISPHVHYEYRRTALAGGECLLTLVGRPGVAVIVPETMAGWNAARALAVLRLKDPQEASYLIYALASPAVQHTIRNWCNTTVQATLNLKEVKQLQIPWPSREIRSAIASTLGALDDKIDLNRRMNETLEAMARAIFKDWFVDFGPTRAKVEGRTPYLSPEIWSRFPHRLDDEGKPEGWSLVTLANYANLNPESWSRKSYPETVEYVDLSGTKWGVIESTETHGRSTAPSRAQRILRLGDTIVGTVRPGNGSFALVNRESLTGSTGFAVLRPRRPTGRELVYIAATQPENIERLSHLADGGAYPAIRPEVVVSTPVIGSCDRLIDLFSDCVRPLLDKALLNLTENEGLSATRDLLLPKLMSGEIRVRDAEKVAETVL